MFETWLQQPYFVNSIVTPCNALWITLFGDRREGQASPACHKLMETFALFVYNAMHFMTKRFGRQGLAPEVEVLGATVASDCPVCC